MTMETVNSIQIGQEKSSPSLLGLSQPIRQRIYSHVGLVPADGYGLSHVFQLHGSNQPEICGFHGLLLSCRTLYDEAGRLLYSTGRFVIHYGEALSLEPLRSLTPLALSNLRHLKVVLNEACCHSSRILRSEFGDRQITEGHRFIPKRGRGKNQYRRWGLPHHDVALLGDEGDLELLIEWERTVENLSSRISPDVLDLSVVCDIFDQEIDIAKRVVSPLALLPLLRNCHVRLSHVPTPEMSRLARDAALKASGKFSTDDQAPMSCLPASQAQPSLCSHLMSLPLELRLDILEYTDIVTPWKEVMWHRKSHVFKAGLTYCSSLQKPRTDCPEHYGCQFLYCWHTYPEPSIGCFCRLKHSAFSSHCKCWEPPLPLFLVCRDLYKEAQAVFFSQNRFVVYDSDPIDLLRMPPPRPSDRFAASVFLEQVVPRDCLGHLRSLEFVFPAYEHRVWPSEGESQLLHWMNTITVIKDELNLSALSIRLVMTQQDGRIHSQDRPESRIQLSNMEGQAILAAYDRILDPLVQLGGKDGLAGFYADFDWPWSRTDEGWANGGEWVKSKKRVLNERAEKMVLGQDRFEHQSTSKSSAWGAKASLWDRRGIRCSGSNVRSHYLFGELDL